MPLLVKNPHISTWKLDGSLVFSDVSGFTKLSEKLAEQGKAGAEELTEILLGTFTDLLGTARGLGGDLLKFGGDALLLAFEGDGHAVRATHAALQMRGALKARGPVQTGKGRVTLRISQGVHSGVFHMVLAGDTQRELLVIGHDATLVTDIEGAASAGQVVVSPSTAAWLPPECLGAEVGLGVVVRKPPPDPPTDGFELPSPDFDRTVLVPPAVRRRAEGGDHESEHRRVAIGFVHVMGVDGHIASEGAERTAEALSLVTGVISAAAADAGVSLLASDLAPDGAKLILTAGAPEAVEDAEGRLLTALRSALDQRLPLPVRAGAHSGHVFAGDVGAPWRHVYTVIGDAVNLSARLMGKAEPGQIVASDALLERSATPFETEALEPFMVKGKRHPQHASVIGERRRGRRRSGHLSAPFVGRRRELDMLSAALAEANLGRGSCVELVGPPGIGKSRLVDELLDRSSGAERIRITCEPFQTTVPYFVARLVLRRLMGIAFDASAGEVGQVLQTVMAELAPAVAPWTPLVATVIDADVPTTAAVDGLDPAHRGTATAEATAALLAALAPQRQVFVFEDAMWMDDASAHVFARALLDINRHPWLVCTTRRDEPGGLQAELGYEAVRIDLEPLPTEVSTQLVRDVTEQFGLSEQDVERLSARAGGNPLYLVELLREVLDAGSLEALPDSLEDILATRVEGLSATDRRLLRLASVLGDRFEADLLAAVATDYDVGDTSAAAERLTEFLARDGRDLVFEHDLLRQVAYERLPYRRRRAIHQQAATILGSRPGRPDDDRLALLAHHWDHAGNGTEAWAAQRRAAARAIRKFAHHEATTLLERALDNGRRIGAPDTDLAEVGVQLGDAAELAGRFDAAIAGYALARRTLPAGDDTSIDLLRKEAMVREKLGRYDAALRWLRRGLRELGERNDKLSLMRRAEFEIAYAGVRSRQGKIRSCVRWAERGLESAEEAGDERTLAHALYFLAGALADVNDQKAAELEARAVEIYRAVGDNLGLGRALMNMGVSADTHGQFEVAASLYEESRTALLGAGYALGLAHVSQNLGEIRSDQGRLGEAEALLKEAKRAATAARYTMMIWATTCGLGRVATRARRLEDAINLLEQSWHGFEQIGAASWCAETHVLIAEAQLFSGSPAAALDASNAARGYGDEAYSSAGISALDLRVRGCAFAALGRLDEADSSIRASIQDATSSGAEYDLALSLVELARLPTTPEGEAADALGRSREISERMGIDLMIVCPLPGTLPAGLISGRPDVVLS